MIATIVIAILILVFGTISVACFVRWWRLRKLPNRCVGEVCHNPIENPRNARVVRIPAAGPIRKGDRVIANHETGKFEILHGTEFLNERNLAGYCTTPPPVPSLRAKLNEQAAQAEAVRKDDGPALDFSRVQNPTEELQ